MLQAGPTVALRESTLTRCQCEESPTLSKRIISIAHKAKTQISIVWKEQSTQLKIESLMHEWKYDYTHKQNTQ